MSKARLDRFAEIEHRQRRGRRQDLIFACFIMLITVLGASTVVTAASGASMLVALR